MELGKTSNLGSLISAVLVGLLALASNQFARMDPRLFRSPQQSEKPVETLPVTKTKSSPAARKLESVATIRKLAEDLEKVMFSQFGRWKAHAFPSDYPQLNRTLTATDKLLAKLAKQTELLDELSSADQMTIVRLLFMAAEIDSQRFDTAFQDWALRLTNADSPQIAAQAAALRFFRGTNLAQPDAPALLDQLRSFSEIHPDPDLGVSFYVNVADELKAQGHVEVARLVIKLGSEFYSGKPGAFRLVRWLIDNDIPIAHPR